MYILVCLSAALVLASGRTFVQLTDIHLDKHLAEHCPDTGKQHNPKFGVRGFQCDSAYNLVDSALSFLGSLDPKPDFVLWSGDTAPHHLPDSRSAASAEISDCLETVSKRLKSFNIPVVPGIGNNDLLDHNKIKGAPCDTVNLLADGFADFLSTAEYKQFKANGGYYTRELSDHLSLITLNTQYWINPNSFVGDCDDPTSPASLQIRWFQTELSQARKNNKRVIVTGHVPPGADYKRSCFKANAASFARYDDVITGGIYGHYHNDDFHVLEHNNQVAGVVWQAPSVTSSYNPAVRVWKYDPHSGEIDDYDQYFADLTKANSEGKLKFVLEYSAKAAYGLKDMTMQSWNELLSTLTLDTHNKRSALYELHKTVGFVKDKKSKEWRVNYGQSLLLRSAQVLTDNKHMSKLANHDADEHESMAEDDGEEYTSEEEDHF